MTDHEFDVEAMVRGYHIRDLLSLDASCCTWRTQVFVIPIEEEGISLLNGPSGSRRVLSFFCARF